MDLMLFVGFLFSLQLICLLAANFYSKGSQSNEDYFLASKSVRFFPLMMTFLATQVGGGTILGSAEEAYRFGYYVFLYPLGASLGLLVLGLGIGKKLADFKVSTIAEILEVVYRSSLLRRIASLLSILSLFMILIGQLIASKKFMISLGLESNLLFIAFWAIVILYTAWGGFKAVIATDMIQAGFFCFVFIITFVTAFLFNNQMDLSLINTTSHFEWDSSRLTGWLILPLLFMMIEQDMGQRCFAAKSNQVVIRASLVSALLTLSICIIPIYFGMLAKSQGMYIEEGASVLMTAIIQTTNPVLSALVGCAIIAAIVSTADSLINAISSNLAQDFKIASLKSIKSLQILTALIAFFAIAFAFLFDNVVTMLMLSYELSVSCLFVPIFAAFFKKKGNYLAAVCSILGGLFGFILFRWIPTFFPRELASIAFSAMGFALAEGIAIWKNRLLSKPA